LFRLARLDFCRPSVSRKKEFETEGAGNEVLPEARHVAVPLQSPTIQSTINLF
jgi:hypothetical protein